MTVFNAALFLLVAFSSVGQESPVLVRIVMPDISDSMVGERINRVREEIIALNTQLPASKEFPLVLIPFSHEPSKAQYLTDEVAARLAINRLQTMGGTNIANALKAGRSAIEKYGKGTSVLLIFISDGEDSNQQAIDRETELLDRLFTSRGAAGLSQSVFLKRWGGANKKLSDSLATNSNVSLIDATTSAIMPITIESTAHIDEVRWVEAGKLATGQLRVESKTAFQLPAKITTLFQAKTKSKKEASAIVNGGLVKLPIEFAVSTEDVQAGKVSIPVSIKIETIGKVANGTTVLPIIKRPKIRIPVSLPPSTSDSDVSVHTLFTGKSRWMDPMAGVASFDVEITIDVDRKTELKGHKIDSESFEIIPTGNCTIPDRVVIQANPDKIGKASFALTAPPINPNAPFDKWTYNLGFRLKPHNPPSFIRYTPTVVDVKKDGILPPHPIEIHLAGKVRAVKPTRWTHLKQPAAEFLCRIDFEGSQAIPEEFKLIGFKDAKGAEMRLPKAATFSEGGLVDARIEMQYGTKQVVLKPVLSNPGTNAYSITCQPFRILPKRWPKPIQLKNVSGGSTLKLMPPPNPFTSIPPCTRFELQAGLDQNSPGFRDLRFDFVEKKTGKILAQEVPLYQKRLIEFEVPDQERPFFESSYENVALEIRPSVPNPTIETAVIDCQLTLYAPLYRFAFIAVALIFVIVVLIVLNRFSNRLLEDQKMGETSTSQSHNGFSPSRDRPGSSELQDGTSR